MYLNYFTDHNFLTGITDMNAVTWSGVICYYNDFPIVSRNRNEITYTIASGVSELVFLDQDRFAVADDDGKLGLYEINATGEKKSEIKPVIQGDNENAILSMSYSAKCNKLATGGLDSR